MKNLFLVLSLAFSGFLYSQTLPALIPADASYVFCIDPYKLNSKSNNLDYLKYLQPLFNEPSNYNEEITCKLLAINDLIKHPSDYGMDKNSKFYVFRREVEGMKGTMYLFNLEDEKLFSSKIIADCNDTTSILTKNIYNAMIYAAGRTAVCVKGKVGTIFIKDYNYYDFNPYYYDMPTPVEDTVVDSTTISTDSIAIEKVVTPEEIVIPPTPSVNDEENTEEKKEKKKKQMIKQMNEYLVFFMEDWLDYKDATVQSFKNFRALSEGGHDAFMYMNTLAIYGRSFTSLYDSPYDHVRRDQNIPKSKIFTEDLSNSYSIDFENGQAIVKITNNYNDKIYPYIKKSYKQKQSKEVFKYIDAHNMLGYMSVAMDLKESGKLYEELFKEVKSQMTVNSKASYILPTVQLVYAFIDKEMLLNTFTGRNFIACTGFQDVKMQYSTYSYDENFKYTEKIVDTLMKQPKMVLVSAIGNKEYAKKLFEIVASYPVFRQINKNLFCVGPDKHNGITVFFSLTEDALVITNDSDLVYNQTNGIPKANQIPAAEQKFIMTHNLAARIYSTEIIKQVQDVYFKNGETLPVFAQMITNYGDIVIQTEEPGPNQSTATAILNLKDDSANSLYMLLKTMSLVK